jgi:pimeloyl-ACP methyl ester carboxylesterase
MWMPHVTALSANFRPYALDIIGNVGFGVNRREISKPENLANWLDEVLAVLAPQRAVNLMGISCGGWIAGQYALPFPKRFRNVVLLAPAVPCCHSRSAFSYASGSFAFLYRALAEAPYAERSTGFFGTRRKAATRLGRCS